MLGRVGRRRSQCTRAVCLSSSMDRFLRDAGARHIFTRKRTSQAGGPSGSEPSNVELQVSTVLPTPEKSEGQ